MIKIQFTYPGDPPTEARLLFGAEFKIVARGGGLGQIAVVAGGQIGIVRFDDVVCDACNAEVRDLDPCCSTDHALYCWECAGDYVLAHTEHASRANPSAGPS